MANGLPDGYEVVEVTGPHATHTLIDGEGRQQKRHPLDALRQSSAGSEAGTVVAVREAAVKRRNPKVWL